MSDRWPRVKLGEVLKEVRRAESVDDEREYSILGAHWYAKGLYTKEIKTGSQIRATKLYRVQADDFVYNRLFAWKGSFAVAVEENDGCYVSGEFPCFEIDSQRLNSRYLWLYFGREPVWYLALGMSSGGTPTSRNRLKVERLLTMTVPLPPLEEQQRIVARIDEIAARIDEARGLRAQAVEEAEALYRSASNQTFEGRARSSADWVPLHRIIARIENGWSPSCHPFPAGEGEWGVIKVGSVSAGRFVHRENKALPVTEEPRPDLQVKDGDFLFGRANTMELVGACAVVQHPPPRLLLCDKIFRFVFEPDAECETMYLCHALKSPPLRRQIEAGATGTSSSMKNISKAKVLQLRVPIPPLREQRRIVTYLDELQAKVDTLKRLQTETQAELDALLPAVLDRAFRGEL